MGIIHCNYINVMGILLKNIPENIKYNIKKFPIFAISDYLKIKRKTPRAKKAIGGKNEDKLQEPWSF